MSNQQAASIDQASWKILENERNSSIKIPETKQAEYTKEFRRNCFQLYLFEIDVIKYGERKTLSNG